MIRPLHLRTISQPDTSDWQTATSPRSPRSPTSAHTRTKSTYAYSDGKRLSTKVPASRQAPTRVSTGDIGSDHVRRVDSLSPVSEQFETFDSKLEPSSAQALQLLTPPVTPERAQQATSEADSNNEILYFDFSRIDYELDRARCIGSGLWSKVHLAEPVARSPQPSSRASISPSTSPSQRQAVSRLFAVKVRARPDAAGIFTQEARILARLQQSPQASEYVVAFHGYDTRNASLVFEGVIGGSLEDFISRLRVMTELSRHLEVRTLFPGLASNLIEGLSFIHASGVVHADIKPANILLDITDDYGLQTPTLRARFIDFSASFVAGDKDAAANAGGTWDYMAPEQLRIQKDLNTPTYASDVWSVGITLLSIIVGGSPYTAACGGNMFMRREAIKSGDPLGFARMDPAVLKRMTACQDFVDCCRLALQKNRDRRATAVEWHDWLLKQ